MSEATPTGLSRRGFIRTSGLTFGALACTAADTVSAAAPVEDPRAGLEQARATMTNVTRITSPNGVQDLCKVSLGGADQWISVRGRNRDNPVLLYVHGGPGAPEMPLSWIFQSPWEDYFTVVQWDQRGAGKSFSAEPADRIGPTMSADQIVADGAELIAYLRKRFGGRKIIVLGQSWGSYVGLRMAMARAEDIAAYVGTGQAINFLEAEKIGYDWVLGQARTANNFAAVRELEAIAPYPNIDGDVPLAKLDVQRKWSVHYGGLHFGRSAYDYYWASARLSPDYTPEDVVNIGRGSQLSLKHLLDDLVRADLNGIRSVPFPVIMMLGRRDFTTPSILAERWLKRLKAPRKKLVWFEASAHLVPIEEPGRFLVELVDNVLPFAHGARGR